MWFWKRLAPGPFSVPGAGNTSGKIGFATRRW